MHSFLWLSSIPLCICTTASLSFHLGGGVFTTEPPTALCVCLVTQLCLTLCDLMDYSPPVSSVHGILQARILEYISSPFSTDLPDPGIEPRLLHCRQIIYCLSLQGSPLKVLQTAKRISRPFMLNQHGSNPARPLTCCKTLGSDITSPNLDFHIY